MNLDVHSYYKNQHDIFVSCTFLSSVQDMSDFIHCMQQVWG